jgi:diguanylate cyclase (GGDEF)-like protein/PAS domain S-box-containing protein
VADPRTVAGAESRPAINVLLVSADADHTRLVRQALAAHAPGEWNLRQVKGLGAAAARLQQVGVAAVLLNLYLPDSRGISTFETLFSAAPLIPILILADRADEAIAQEATRRGAQDYLLKEHLDAYWLPRILRSVIERKAAEEALFLEKERAQVTLNSIGDAVLSMDIAGNVTYLNKVAETMTGWTCQEATGQPLARVFRIVDGTTREPAPDPLLQAVQENRTVGLSANCILIRRDGTESAIEDSAAPIHNHRGQVTGAVIVFHDIGMAPTIVKKMAHLAQHDDLTGLPNRLLFGDRVASAIALAHRHGRQCAVLFLDLDGFKTVNDSRGHSVGDQLLRLAARRLLDCVRSSDTVSRHGGDEFLVLLAEIGCPEDAARTAKKLLVALAEPYAIAGEVLQRTVSIGISIYPGDGRDAEAVIKSADAAMYRAKDRGRNNYQFFRNALNARANAYPSFADAASHNLRQPPVLAAVRSAAKNK